MEGRDDKHFPARRNKGVELYKGKRDRDYSLVNP